MNIKGDTRSLDNGSNEGSLFWAGSSWGYAKADPRGKPQP